MSPVIVIVPRGLSLQNIEERSMARKSQVILTNMCLIEDNQNRIVMQIRDSKMYSWSGAALPGGHIE